MILNRGDKARLRPAALDYYRQRYVLVRRSGIGPTCTIRTLREPRVCNACALPIPSGVLYASGPNCEAFHIDHVTNINEPSDDPQPRR
jgi:hypothetical protein